MDTDANAPLTLGGFLERTGARLHVYDMGRRVSPITTELFRAFELGEEPYPWPMQQKAWFALVQAYPDSDSEPLIWFLRFDLDEQARLVLATRDYLIHRFVEIASDPKAETDLGQAMRDNPYAFAPREDKMANLHAQVHRDLGRGVSQYYRHARNYLGGAPGWEQWSFVGYQGLADIAARQDQDNNAAILTDAIPHLPDEPLIALCQCLENHVPAPSLAEAPKRRLEQAVSNGQSSPALLAALLRGQSQASLEQVAHAITRLLANPRSADPEILAAIGGRAWESLARPAVARAYLERLASDAVEQAVFDQCVGDLLRMPGLQRPVLEVLRADDRSERVARAFGRMLGQSTN